MNVRRGVRLLGGMAVLAVGGVLFVPSFLIALVAAYFYVVGYIVDVVPRWTAEIVIAVAVAGAGMIALGIRTINGRERRR
jgi:hypothetical protein